MAWLFLLLSVLCSVLATGCLGFSVLAAADPEGRAGNIVLWTLSGAAVLGIATVVLAIMSVSRFIWG